jgi:multicomponent Na+:H+ antiporter subunit C
MLFLSLLVSVMMAVGVYLFMQRSFLNFLCGVIIISNAVTIFLATVSGDPDGKKAPIISKTGVANYIDPLPQALTLTAIVIGFAVLAFLVAVIFVQFHSSKSTSWGTQNER